MKRISIIFLSASLLASAAFADTDQVVATYKGGEVKESQVMKEIQPFLANQPGGKDKKFSDFDPNLQETLVRGYIDAQLIKEAAKSSGIESSKEFQEKLNNIKEQMVNQQLLENYVKANVSDKMVTDEYNKLVASLKGKEEIKVSHILVETEDTAKEVQNRLKKGENFAKLAKEFSKDEGSKASGGEIGYITPGQLVPEFEDKAFSMKVKEISNPVKTQFGWHIITILDKRPAQVPSKEKVTPELTSKLGREAIQKYIADLESKADVKIILPKISVPAEANKKDSK
ncbi:MAG: peptidylprolyl isomerase [Rickettsia endosymbiont of Bryobia graminum]|nr:peptidylprolyl isomerase [Rickettsia endosymbiont of Bryobia graminum]